MVSVVNTASYSTNASVGDAVRTHQLGQSGEEWAAGRLRALGYDVQFMPRNAKAVDLAISGASRFNVQVKCSDHQHIKFPNLSALDGLKAEDFVIALMPASDKRDMTFDEETTWVFVAPAAVAQKAARHVHEEYRKDYIDRKGVEPKGSFGPTVKFYRNTPWHNQARLWLWAYRDAWGALPPPA